MHRAARGAGKVDRLPGGGGGFLCTPGDLVDARHEILDRARHDASIPAHLFGSSRHEVGLGRGLLGRGAHLLADAGQFLRRTGQSMRVVDDAGHKRCLPASLLGQAAGDAGRNGQHPQGGHGKNHLGEGPQLMGRGEHFRFINLRDQGPADRLPSRGRVAMDRDRSP